MKSIRQRLWLLGIAGILSLVIFILYLFQNELPFSPVLFQVMIALAIIVIFVFLIWEYMKFKKACLIMENKILHIQSARIINGIYGRYDNTSPIGGIEVYISCFGILLDTKVIKFNLDGIHLKAVEISNEYICLTYGTDVQRQKIEILHETIDDEELQIMIEKFRYETGIIPVVKNY